MIKSSQESVVSSIAEEARKYNTEYKLPSVEHHLFREMERKLKEDIKIQQRNHLIIKEKWKSAEPHIKRSEINIVRGWKSREQERMKEENSK